MRGWLPLKIGLVAILLASVAGGCSVPSTATTTHKGPGGTLTERLTGDWDSFDPKLHQIQGVAVRRAVYDNLVATDASGKIIPYLAKSWQQTATSITFTVRTDAICSDGTRLTPTMIANAVRYYVSKSSFSNYEFGPGPYTVTGDDGAGTVTMVSQVPYSDMLYGFLEVSISCPAGLANPSLFQEQPSGSGPYTLVSAVHGDQATFKLRSEWKWGPAGITAQTDGLPSTLVFKVVVNDSTAANLLHTGALDLTPMSGLDIPRLVADKSVTHKTVNAFDAALVSMNEGAGHPTADETVRRALVTAVDPNGWNKAAYNGYGAVSPNVLTPTAQCYDASTAKLLPKPSTSDAKQILIKAGYTVGGDGKLTRDGKTLSVRLVGYSSQNAGPEYLLEQFQAAGFDVQPSFVDYATFAAILRSGNWDVMVPNYFAFDSRPDPDAAFFSGLPYPQGTNFASIADPAVDQAKAAGLLDFPPASCKSWQTFWRTLISNHHLLPLSAPANFWFAKPGVDYIPAATLILNDVAHLRTGS